MVDGAQDGTAPAWRWRTPLLAALGAAAALVARQLVTSDRIDWSSYPYTAVAEWRIGLAVAVVVSALVFGFVAERVRWRWSVAFALAAGAVAGLVRFGHGGGARDGWGLFEWRYAALALAIGIAAPLFQVARDEGRRRFPYRAVHAHAWTDAVLWFAAWAFTGTVLALAWLLAGLFDLIGIDLLTDALREGWFAAALLGAAFGGGLGLLRERDRVLGLLQRVVLTVLAVLAPVLGAGLALFLLALPFTGVDALWEATRSTTPVLLGCVLGALVLANAVIGSDDAEEARTPVLRSGALALGVAVLPLGVIAAVATGLRIAQHGLTPDRLWAVMFTAIAAAYGLAYLVAVVRRRLDWAAKVRVANLRLSFAVAGIALLLASPLVSFEQLSTDEQVAKLRSGRIAPDRFDWAALTFDFGEPGRRAVKELGGSANAAVARYAKDAATKTSRYAFETADEVTRRREARRAVAEHALIVRPAPAPVPAALRGAVFGVDVGTDAMALEVGSYGVAPCSATSRAPCRLFWRPSQAEAIALQDDCALLSVEQRSDPATNCTVRVGAFRLRGNKWERADEVLSSPPPFAPEETRAAKAAERAAVERDDVSIREVARRQLFVGDKPVGRPFE